MAIKDTLERVFPTTSEEEQKKLAAEKIHQRWLAIERNRKAREVYEVKEISGWMYVGPFLGLLVAIIAGLMIWASGVDNAGEELWWIVGIGLAPMMLFGFASTLEEEWKASVAAKEELHKADPRTDEDGISADFGTFDRLLHGFKYKYDYFYTDKTWLYWLYAGSKNNHGVVDCDLWPRGSSTSLHVARHSQHRPYNRHNYPPRSDTDEDEVSYSSSSLTPWLRTRRAFNRFSPPIFLSAAFALSAKGPPLIEVPLITT